jgi:dTDP-4-dehydrorhamnose reductase
MIRTTSISSRNSLGQGPLEIWGGVECTCNRVGDRYFDQMELSGHAARRSDFERFAAMGISRLRCGLLWERNEATRSWDSSDRLLTSAQDAGIRPIAGLIHHGSGPPHTSLLDPGFPEALAAYAGKVARRYPWIDAYTPVNEPNTTARFSGLYGVWFPHHRTRHSYLRALLNQIKATVLSMEAIRCVRSDARLIQTDDCGSIRGTEELRSTWELLDLRQWLSFDLLHGCVDRHHPMFNLMRREGISEHEILWFAERPCPPDVIGLNYYVTSDRYIDHRLDNYPDTLRSSEGPFVDLEAVRVCPAGIRGFGAVLRESWSRYSLPVALTEVHLGCDVDEQIRWLVRACEDAVEARRSGVNCVALTVWALLGSFFWNQLVTCDNGHYEPGAFDMRSGHPRATALAQIVEQLARGDRPQHPALAGRGWWETGARLLFPCGEANEEEIAA